MLNSVTHIIRRPLSGRLISDAAKRKSSEILSEFQDHKANHHPIFRYLSDLSSGEGLNPRQFSMCQVNFFYRTANTLVSAAIHSAKAIKDHDYRSVALSASNVADEGGHGDSEGVHLQLLEDCYNTHAAIVFGLPSIAIVDAESSEFLLKEALQFRNMQREIFRSSYATMTGCVLAQEDAADMMLRNFRLSLFENFRGYYNKSQYKTLMRYFDEHYDESKTDGNIEQQHGEKALEAVARLIERDSRSVPLIRKGGLKFLAAQSLLWDAMMDAIENAKGYGPTVKPKLEFLEENELPLPVVKASRFGDIKRDNIKVASPRAFSLKSLENSKE